MSVDYTRDSKLVAAGVEIIKDRYLIEGEQSPQEGFLRAAVAFSDSPAMAARMYDYVSNLWAMYSTPEFSNAPERISWGRSLDNALDWNEPFHPENYKPARGLPISCFLNMPDDSLKGIENHWSENVYLASRGGGIGGHWSGVRSDGAATSKGSSSNGIIPFLKVCESEMAAVSQGKTRRGSYSAYLDISHPEIEEFISIRKPTGGDLNRKTLNAHHGVNIPHIFMEIIDRCVGNAEENDDWPLVDPNSGEVTKIVSARYLWEQILETRIQFGEPYIAFIDTINDAVKDALKAIGYKINGSNLCSEITLRTTPDRTAVCCLMSVNLDTYDEWRDHPRFLQDIVRFQDNVLEYFILNAPEEMWRATASAAEERSIGIGSMGFHSYLQSRGVPFESPMAVSINKQIFRHIEEKTDAASRVLAKERGEPPLLRGLGIRNAHVRAIAPNASSSLICGAVSPSIEPLRANAFTQKTMSGSFTIKNKYLEDALRVYVPEGLPEEAAKSWMDKQWRSIITNKGSVQHLDYLSDWEKEIFKTAMEMDQRWLLTHVADRTPHIDQSQSFNLFLPPEVSVVELHGLHMMAWKKGIKTMYYLRSESLKRAETVSTKIERTNLGHFSEETCVACEG